MTDQPLLEDTAVAFRDMAHSIVWCVAATVDRHGRPSSRVLHPIWEWDGEHLSGWVATDPTSPKARHIEAMPEVSFTYWSSNHDTCTADCSVTWVSDQVDRHEAWDRFLNAPPPVGYDPTLIPAWTSPDAPAFGVLRLTPRRLRVMPGSLMLSGEGRLHTWSA